MHNYEQKLCCFHHLYRRKTAVVEINLVSNCTANIVVTFSVCLMSCACQANRRHEKNFKSLNHLCRLANNTIFNHLSSIYGPGTLSNIQQFPELYSDTYSSRLVSLGVLESEQKMKILPSKQRIMFQSHISLLRMCMGLERKRTILRYIAHLGKALSNVLPFIYFRPFLAQNHAKLLSLVSFCSFEIVQILRSELQATAKS